MTKQHDQSEKDRQREAFIAISGELPEDAAGWWEFFKHGASWQAAISHAAQAKPFDLTIESCVELANGVRELISQLTTAKKEADDERIAHATTLRLLEEANEQIAKSRRQEPVAWYAIHPTHGLSVSTKPTAYHTHGAYAEPDVLPSEEELRREIEELKRQLAKSRG